LHIGNNQSAVKYYRKILKESEDPLWLIKAEEKLGEINFSFLKKYNDSIENYIKLVNFIPKLEKSDFYKFRLAMSLLKNNQLKRSFKIFLEIKNDERSKYSVRSIFYLGVIAFQSKRWMNVVKHLSDYIKKETRKDSIVQAKFLIANSYETMEQLKKAYNIYYSILGKYPNTAVVQNRLQSIYDRRIARKR